MKHYLYPSVLQKQGMEAIKESKSKNVLIHYQEMSGIKLTVFIPLLNQQIRAAIDNSAEGTTKPIYTLVLCHSFLRC